MSHRFQSAALTDQEIGSTMHPDGAMNAPARFFSEITAMRLPFLELARRRVVVLDGAMGSNLQTRTLDLQRDWMGHENISEVLNFSRPEVIQEIHEAFLAVGCDAVETNTFGANKIVLAEADMLDRVFENNVAAARIAREACDKFEAP